MHDEKELERIGTESQKILELARSLVKPGVSIAEVANKIDDEIRSKKLHTSFPINISINEQAAHYTPSFDDKAVFSPNDVVKIDIGLRSGSELTDCAITVDLSSKHSKLVDATNEACDAAIKKVKAGTRLCDIGAVVEEIAARSGFKPVKNLGGHGLEEGELHAHYFIPNFDNGDTTELQDGDLVAIEVFLTDGEGYVDEGDTIQIFQKAAGAHARASDLRTVSTFIEEEYSSYPFALRWLVKKFGSEFKPRATLNELARNEALEQFPVLIERKKGMVAQSEHTVLVQKGSCKIVV